MSAIKAIIATQYDPTGLKQAQKAFSGVGKTLKTALGAIGIGVGISALTSSLKEATRQASDDAKAQILLAQQLRNTANATDTQIASVENAIAKMAIQTAIADDQLRPAMASLVRATGDVTKAQGLLGLSLDVSAATGKDLQSVSLAIGKAVSGQTSALFRMIPGLKGSKDWMQKLKDETKGMAEAAGQQDPYMRLKVIFDELQETIGFGLLPYLNEVADYFASPEGQQNLQDFAVSVTDAVKAIADLGKGMADLAPIADPVFGYLNGLIAAFTGNTQRAAEIFQGMFGTMTAETNAGRAINQTSKARLLGQRNPSSGMGIKVTNTFTTSTKNATSAVKKLSAAQTAAKKAAAEAAAALKEQQAAAAEAAAEVARAIEAEKQALTDFKMSMLEATKGILTLTNVQKDLGEFQQSVVSTFDSINQTLDEGILAGTFGQKGLSELRSFLASEQALLEENARQRDELIKKRGLAQALINDVKSAIMGVGSLANLMQTETKTITTSMTQLVNGFAVTTKTTVEEVIGAKGIVGRLKEVVAKTKAFAGQLSELKKLGLSPDLFKQIVDAGPDVGGQLATEILDGGADSVKALNDTFDELAKVSADVAEQTAVVMYNGGVEVVGGLVNGLLSQEQALIEAAKTLAMAFVEQFNALMANLQIPSMSGGIAANTVSVAASSLDTFDYARILAGAGNPLTSEDIRFAQIGQRVGATVNVTVNAGVGTNGKSVGQAIQAELNKYAASSR